MSEVRLRADARRNRDQIIAIATQLFRERGPEVPMEEIARGAGVGIGTLYRRFPDRDALIRAVAVEAFEGLAAEFRALAGRQQDSWQALRDLIQRATDLRLPIMLSTLSTPARHSVLDDERITAARQTMLDLLESLLAAAQRDGRARADVGTGDVLALVSMTLRPIPSVSAALADTVARRCLAVVLDGLARQDTTLPGRRLTLTDITPWQATDRP